MEIVLFYVMKYFREFLKPFFRAVCNVIYHVLVVNVIIEKFHIYPRMTLRP